MQCGLSMEEPDLELNHVEEPDLELNHGQPSMAVRVEPSGSTRRRRLPTRQPPLGDGPSLQARVGEPGPTGPHPGPVPPGPTRARPGWASRVPPGPTRARSHRAPPGPGDYLAALQLWYEGRPDPAMRLRVGSTGCRVVVVLFVHTRQLRIFSADDVSSWGAGSSCPSFLQPFRGLSRRGTPDPSPGLRIGPPAGAERPRARAGPGRSSGGDVLLAGDEPSFFRPGLAVRAWLDLAALGPCQAPGVFGVRRRLLRGFPASGGRAPPTQFSPLGVVVLFALLSAHASGRACSFCFLLASGDLRRRARPAGGLATLCSYAAPGFRPLYLLRAVC
jgi:hypothetical protein